MRFVLLTLLLASAAGAVAREPGFAEFRAVQESLSRVPPRLRARGLNERGLEVPGINAPMPAASLTSESTALRLVGKYGRGPSVEVTGRDSLVFLSLGSEVAIVSFADTANPRVLAEVQAMGLVTQAAVRDSFLYIGCKAGQAGIEVWNVQNPSAPVFRSRTPSLLSDFCVRDTYLYLTQSLSGPNDTFKVYSTANPVNVYLLGSCRDSGDAVTVTNNAAFLADRWGLYSVDVSDPSNPHQVGTYPGMPISVEGRGNICCVTFGNPNQPELLRFTVLDVTNPANVVPLGSIDSCGGYDIHMDSSLAFVSGYYTGGHEFRVVSIADSSHPVRVGACSTPGDNWGVWSCMARRRVFVADNYEGLSVIDLQNLSAPLLDTTIVAAAFANDVHVADSVCYVADGPAGMRILDLSDPTRPREIGAVDTTGDCYSQSVVARDSFAFTDWAYPYLRSISVTDPAKPDKAGACIIFNRAEDMALRDSLLYVAEDDKFQIVNVARPRQPQVVGTCGLPDMTFGLYIWDTLAYVANAYSLNILDIAQPANPHIVGMLDGYPNAMDKRDTFLFVVSDFWLVSYCVADPVQPRVLDSVRLTGHMHDVLVLDSIAYCGGWVVQMVDVADPQNMRVLPGTWLPPSLYMHRLVYARPYIYAACTDGGVCVLETLTTGLAEIGRPIPMTKVVRAAPNPARNWTDIILTSPLSSPCRFMLFDATGREVASVNVAPGSANERRTRIEIEHLAPGLYFLRACTEGQPGVLKIVKQ